jgi:hypothetical protein
MMFDRLIIDAAVHDDDLLRDGAFLIAVLADLVNDGLTVDDMAEYDMFVVEEWAFLKGDVELGGVGVLFAHVCHAYFVGFVVGVEEDFVREEFSIYGLATCAVMINDVPCLDHEAGYDPVEVIPLVVQRLTTFSHSLFPCTQRSEVLCCLRALAIQ